MSYRLPLATALPLVLAAPAIAQTVPAPATDTSRGEIIVTAPVLTSERDVLQGTSVLTGTELTRELRSTIGETLARQPGVSATSFGPNASRPILRGFQGERIRVLTDGIGSFDVSNTSADHAVAIDPLLAERVEVLRGPSALLFGSSAVGGVVNVIDSRIPRHVPENGASVRAIGNYGTAARERSVGAAADVAVGRNFVLHADGSYLKSGDLRAGRGFLLSPQARAAALSQVGLPQDDHDDHDHDHDDDHGHGHGGPIDFAANANLRGRIPNTAAQTWTAGVGGSLITDTGMLGLSYSHYDSLYGVPIRYATRIGQEQEEPRIDARQDRVDLRAEVQTGGGIFDRIRLRAGHADYRHFELEPDGEIHTEFYSKGTEGRLELVQTRRGGWQGASGIQYLDRTIEAVGEEAFIPRAATEQVGVFTLQQLDLGRLRAEGGVRYERTEQASRVVNGDTRFFGGTRTFDALSGSLGASYEVARDTRFGLNLSRTARAPSAEELFANGPHAGTQAYELGNPNFARETSWGVEATFHAHGNGFSFDASAYHSWFRNFIYEAQTAQGICEAAAAPSGRDVDLPCFQFNQADARYYGFEADASVRLATVGSYAINFDAVGDYVRATIRGNGPAPRIPPLRLLGGLEAQGPTLTARAEVERVFAQNRVTNFETTTPGFTLVNASLSFKPFDTDRAVLMVSANNIFDQLARRHASVLKDFAPLSGRDIRATVRIGF
ncbi:MAG: TonB-dependent receptor [Sphingomonadales bacterium]|nr:TonB-dependent receptor [Sphingomonadales bacterium]